jgi:N-acetylmuramoyl-L-alanine amidase
MENGFLTNAAELANMMDSAVLQQKAEAMAHAVAQYFLKINQ